MAGFENSRVRRKNRIVAGTSPLARHRNTYCNVKEGCPYRERPDYVRDPEGLPSAMKETKVYCLPGSKIELNCIVARIAEKI